MYIPEGAILIARIIKESDIWIKKPPAWLKIWLFILMNVSHKSTKQFPRGTGFFNFQTNSQELANISANQWHECVAWLKCTKQITTRKTTRGNVIFVVNYAKYQELQNYKTDTETDTPTETQPKHNRHYIQECKNVKNDTYMCISDFDAFWLQYPNKVNKRKAQEKFLKLNQSLLPKLLKALEVQKKSGAWTKDNGKFIPHPTTWLNGARWEDEFLEQTEMLAGEALAKFMVDKYGKGDVAYCRYTDYLAKKIKPVKIETQEEMNEYIRKCNEISNEALQYANILGI